MSVRTLANLAAKRFSLLIANSGLRFCEAISLVEGDLNYETGMLAVTKSTVEVSAEFHPTGGRFLTRQYIKNGEVRAFTIDLTVAQAIKQHVEQQPQHVTSPTWTNSQRRQQGSWAP